MPEYNPSPQPVQFSKDWLTEARLKLMAEKSHPKEVQEAEAFGEMFAGFVMLEAERLGYL